MAVANIQLSFTSIPSNAKCVSYSRKFKYRDQVVDCKMYIALIVPTVIPTWYLVICHLCQLWTPCQMPPVPVMNFLPDATCASYEVPASCRKTHVLRLMFRGLKTWEPVSITCATRAKSHTYRSITFSSLKQPNPLSALLSSLNLDNCNSLLSGCPQYLLDKL